MTKKSHHFWIEDEANQILAIVTDPNPRMGALAKLARKLGVTKKAIYSMSHRLLNGASPKDFPATRMQASERRAERMEQARKAWTKNLPKKTSPPKVVQGFALVDARYLSAPFASVEELQRHIEKHDIDLSVCIPVSILNRSKKWRLE